MFFRHFYRLNFFYKKRESITFDWVVIYVFLLLFKIVCALQNTDIVVNEHVQVLIFICIYTTISKSQLKLIYMSSFYYRISQIPQPIGITRKLSPKCHRKNIFIQLHQNRNSIHEKCTAFCINCWKRFTF